ncbi:MAG: class II fructose-bisphosphate aldolase [Anaerolineales bacterium]|jgi:tagatose 1,6-diphosphate aldolase GatY/KbaY|nr:class II fructose-bisphosphate aldolase [Anaerolineales bacterium]
METTLQEMLQAADHLNYAVGAFNVYNLEGIKAVISAAEQERSPVILQLHPAAVKYGSQPLIAAAKQAVQECSVRALVHLDHATDRELILSCMQAGVRSVMADGSHLSLEDNIAFTAGVTSLAREHSSFVEAELGRLSGTEDGLSVAEYEARLTDPAVAARFVRDTGVHCLAVCIGNVHGHYRGEPRLDFSLLERIKEQVAIPLVLHGASGLSEEHIRKSIRLGIRKFNVNTEVRDAYLSALSKTLAEKPGVDLVDLMSSAVARMRAVVIEKMNLFGSSGKD